MGWDKIVLSVEESDEVKGNQDILIFEEGGVKHELTGFSILGCYGISNVNESHDGMMVGQGCGQDRHRSTLGIKKEGEVLFISVEYIKS